MLIPEGGDTSVRMPDGQVLLTVPEAAELWKRIGSVNITPGIYRRKCKSGELQASGIRISDGPRFLTDLDSLLDYFESEWVSIGEKLREAQEERRRQLEEWKRAMP